MNSLLQNMTSTIVSGLKYQSIRLCSVWSERFRVMGKPFPGPYSVRHHPWAKEMLDYDGNWVGPKAAQMGYTEVALNRCFFSIDIKKLDTMYILPKASPDATDFSAARFGPALDLSDHLKTLFSENNNVGHKRAGAINLYVRGAQSRSGLKSVPAGLIIFDELDEMPHKNVMLAEQRVAGQLESQIIKISTPSVPEFGIDLAFRNTTQEHFHFRCPCCNRFTELTFPECIVIVGEHVTDPRLKESHYICKECKGVLPHEGKIDYLNTGVWVPTVKAADRGFHVNRMYSMAEAGQPEIFAKEKLKADLDQLSEQEFHNSILGKAHVVAGARVTDAQLLGLLRGWKRGGPPPSRSGIRVMGVDVGKWIHYEICDYFLTQGFSSDINVMSNCRQLDHGKVMNFEDLDTLMKQWQVLMCVIDAHPERRKAREFAARFPNHVYLCFYTQGLKGNECSINTNGMTISVDRTSWLDLSLGRFFSKRIELPQDTTPEYKLHVGNLIRKLERDSDGNPTASYISIGDDHYGHARNYAELALPLAASLQTNQDIAKFL